MRKYLKANIFPIIIEAIFIVSCFIVPKEYYVYSNFLFYLILAVYFWCKKDFSIKVWLNNLKSGKNFWKQVVLTALGFISAFVITMVLESVFPNFNSGMIGLKINSWVTLILFALSTILLPPITEEIFFRKNVISFKNRGVLIITVTLGMFLYALEHSLAPWGILLSMIWALPLSLSYLKTKNVYVPMTAHFICNLTANGIDVVFAIIAMLANQ